MINYTEIPYSVNIPNYFKLKDIIKWCNENKNYTLSEKLLLYIKDNNLCNDKLYCIKKLPYKNYIKDEEQKFIKYLGYYLQEREDNDSIGVVQK